MIAGRAESVDLVRCADGGLDVALSMRERHAVDESGAPCLMTDSSGRSAVPEEYRVADCMPS